MSHERNGSPVILTHERVPSGARRVLMFSYYDGALDGVLEADTGDVYRFDSLAGAEELVGRKHRTYTLRPLPNDALDRLVAIIEPHVPARWPAWVPTWDFPDDAIEADVEARTDAILDQAGPVQWQISTDDFYSLSRFTTEPVRAAPATRD